MIIPTIKAEPPTITTVCSPEHKPIITNRAPTKRVANVLLVSFLMLFLDLPVAALAAGASLGVGHHAKSSPDCANFHVLFSEKVVFLIVLMYVPFGTSVRVVS